VGSEVRLAFALGWLDPGGRWSENQKTIAERLTAAAGCVAGGAPDPDRLHEALVRLSEPIRTRLAAARERRWALAEADRPARVVAAGLQQAIREAARRRDASALEALERALGFVAGGHTAGEAILLERLAATGAAELARTAARLPLPSPRWGPVEARLSECCCSRAADQSLRGGRAVPSARRAPAAKLEVVWVEHAGHQGEVGVPSRRSRAIMWSARVAAVNQTPGSMPGYRLANSGRSRASRTG
jgi:hypothetical protein